MLIKVYVALLFGQCGIEKLGEVATSFRNLAGYSADEVMHIHKNVGHITELLRLLPSGSHELERAIEFLDEYDWEKRIEGGQRELAEFNAYIRFNSVLREFWEQATREEKLTYFPVYLWWNLTAILPLRPSELIRTPRNCLRTEKGKELIIIRRSRLKGVDRLSYRIDDDYDQYTYPRLLTRPESLVSNISINGGWCMSKEMEKNSVKDCLKSIGKHGEVGECKNCQYYSLDAAGTHIEVLDCEKSKAEVREDSWFLMSMIEAVRKGMGCEGDLQSAITRLQHSCAKYRSCLEHEYVKEVL